VDTKRRTGWIRTRAAAAAAVVAALAIAAPVAEASAATSPAVSLPTLPALPALPTLPALPAFQVPPFTPGSLSFVGPSIGSIGVAIGPTVIGSVFNGGTTVCVSTVASNCSTNASP
jgi:hypothetical protein